MAARKKSKTEAKSRKQKTLKRQKLREDKSKHYTKIKRQIASVKGEDDVFRHDIKQEQLKRSVMGELEKNVTIHDQTQSNYSPSVLKRAISGFLFPVTCLVNFSMTKV